MESSLKFTVACKYQMKDDLANAYFPNYSIWNLNMIRYT